MKKILFAVIFLASLNLHGEDAYDCQVRLLGEELDSNSFYVNGDSFSKGIDEDSVSFSHQAILSVRHQVGCKLSPLGADEVYCRELKSEDKSSKVCGAQTPEGVYYVIADFLGNARVIYNRWD